MTRDYRREYDTYHKTEAQTKRRAARNKARRMMERSGRVEKGDSSREVDHKNKNPLDNSSDNLRIRSKSANRRDQ
jgi:hypothetical protein